MGGHAFHRFVRRTAVPYDFSMDSRRRFAGNGIHLLTVGRFLLYIMSNVVRKDVVMRMAPMPTIKEDEQELPEFRIAILPQK